MRNATLESVVKPFFALKFKSKEGVSVGDGPEVEYWLDSL